MPQEEVVCDRCLAIFGAKIERLADELTQERLLEAQLRLGLEGNERYAQSLAHAAEQMDKTFAQLEQRSARLRLAEQALAMESTGQKYMWLMVRGIRELGRPLRVLHQGVIREGDSFMFELGAGRKVYLDAPAIHPERDGVPFE